ncbi:MAG: flagellar filament capping protein FliD [Butyrivibrio sp.]|uniref:flagellar filament capping protein FliD n=1 Tax=Butyrivibrio sp. TaxID=28121 RepID=UPI0025BE621E|nr:flagellar filament capping protein FliD [Butyrivibrio sp.]MBQ6588670.1 flagellar filament capping protein FliD [Butyrivibrio sp.]
MPIRITGMNSGLDTESIITALTSTKKTKWDTAVGDQKKLTWKQDKWKELNKKVVSFYNGALSSMRFSTAYTKKTTSVSNENAASVITGDGAMDTTQNLSIKSLATAAYLTGSKIDAKKDTDVSELDLAPGDKLEFKIGGNANDVLSVSIEEGDTIEKVLSKLKNAKSSESQTQLNFNFDENNGRFFVSAKEAGVAAGFELAGDADTMKKLGFEVKQYEDGSSNYIAGTKAKITLNGETYESDSNTFEINGLTITAKQVAENVTLTTKQDTSGIYDNIKNMIKEYNDLMKEFAKLYNADAAKKYKMLTDDEKDAMSDKEVEAWEEKIKDGLLSKDETVGNLRTAMRDIMNSSMNITLKDGTTKSLSLASFGISTGSYFGTEENERDVFHIDGDKDDTTSSGNTDLLSAFISTDPQAVQDFFSQLSKDLYGKLSDLMKGTQYSSSFTIYEDKLMASQYSAYNTKISDAQKAYEAAQDKYYKQFSKMETALAKVNSTSGSLTSFFGGGS